MDGGRARALVCGPRNGRAKSVINLERAGPISKMFQPFAIPRRQRGSCDPEQLTWSYGGENQVCPRQLDHFAAGFNATAKGLEVMSKGIAQHLSSAADDGPATTVSGSHQDETYCSRSWCFQRQD